MHHAKEMEGRPKKSQCKEQAGNKAHRVMGTPFGPIDQASVAAIKPIVHITRLAFKGEKAKSA